MRREPPSLAVALLAALALALAGASPARAAEPAAAGPGAGAAERLRAEHLERGLAAQRDLLARFRANPAAFQASTDRPGAHLLFDAVADCEVSERLGRAGDGGKWVCNPHKLKAQKPCVAYGFGAGTDISFEEALAKELGCEVHVFDPTPSAVARFAGWREGRRYGAGSVTLHPWGLGPVSSDPGSAMKLELEGKACEVRTLAQIAKALGHGRVDVLKVDIEGGEWAALAEILGSGALEDLKVSALLAELHLWRGATPLAMFELFDALSTRGFFLYRKELNPWTPGCCAEYAFAGRRLVK